MNKLKKTAFLISVLSLSILISSCDLPSSDEDTKDSFKDDTFEEEPPDDSSNNVAECTFPLERLEVQAWVLQDGQTNQDEDGVFIYRDFATVEIFDTQLPPIKISDKPFFVCDAIVKIDDYELNQYKSYSMYFSGDDIELSGGNTYELSIDLGKNGTVDVTGEVTLSTLSIKSVKIAQTDIERSPNFEEVEVFLEWSDVGDIQNTMYNVSIEPTFENALRVHDILEGETRTSFIIREDTSYFSIMSATTEGTLSVPEGYFRAEWMSTTPFAQFPPIRYYPNTDPMY